jgi:Big-like domain-containing protein
MIHSSNTKYGHLADRNRPSDRYPKIRRVWTYRWVPVNNATVSCNRSSSCTTATLDTPNLLAAKTTYWATITTRAKDTNGNLLAQEYPWTFTTGSS